MNFVNKLKKKINKIQEVVDKDENKNELNKSSHQDLSNKFLEKCFESISADVDKLKAQSEANNELRQLFSEKFSRIDEQIGELRNMLVDREKEIQQLESKATKASDMVSEVQPEKLYMQTKKEDAKIEILKLKIEAQEQISETILGELKSIRNDIRTFRGVKKIQDLTKELLDEQTIIKKIDARIESHSDKIEAMFLETNKKYEEFRHYKEDANNLDKRFTENIKEFQKLKVNFENLASKDDLYDFKKEMKKFTEPLNIYQKKIQTALFDFKDIQKEFKPVIKKYKKIENEQKYAEKDFDNYKTLLKEKLNHYTKNNEQIILGFQKKYDLIKNQENKIIKEMDVNIRNKIKEFQKIIDLFNKDNKIEKYTNNFKKLQNNLLINKDKTNNNEVRLSRLEKENDALKISINKLRKILKKIIIHLKN